MAGVQTIDVADLSPRRWRWPAQSNLTDGAGTTRALGDLASSAPFREVITACLEEFAKLLTPSAHGGMMSGIQRLRWISLYPRSF